MKNQEQYNQLLRMKELLSILPDKHMHQILNEVDNLHNELNEISRLLAIKEEDCANKNEEINTLSSKLEVERNNFTLLENFIDGHLSNEIGTEVYKQFHEQRSFIK